MKLVLPLPANRANSRWHWRTEKKLRDDYFWRCCVAYPRACKETIPRADVVADFYLWNARMDIDNLYARLKWPLDFLVEFDYLPDDGPEQIVSLVVHQKCDRKNPRLEIHLEHAVT